MTCQRICQDCGHIADEEDCNGLTEEEVASMLNDDAQSGDIGTPDDYTDLVGVSACPECRSYHLDYHFAD